MPVSQSHTLFLTPHFHTHPLHTQATPVAKIHHSLTPTQQLHTAPVQGDAHQTYHNTSVKRPHSLSPFVSLSTHQTKGNRSTSRYICIGFLFLSLSQYYDSIKPSFFSQLSHSHYPHTKKNVSYCFNDMLRVRHRSRLGGDCSFTRVWNHGTNGGG